MAPPTERRTVSIRREKLELPRGSVTDERANMTETPLLISSVGHPRPLPRHASERLYPQEF